MVNPMKDCRMICGCAAMLAACAVAEDYIRLTIPATTRRLPSRHDRNVIAAICLR